MKQKWFDAFCEAAAAGRRFDHADNCRGSSKVSLCRCAAGPANRALDEIAKGLKVGIPLDGENLARQVISFLDDNATFLEGEDGAKKLYRAAAAMAGIRLT